MTDVRKYKFIGNPIMEWSISFFLDVFAAVEHLMQTQVRECASGYICLQCGKTFQRRFVVKRHMRDLHVAARYHCPTCNKMFRNRTSIYDHIKKVHPAWKGVDYDNFLDL
jgi:uncharacterized C2H2 Zn-finger protein